MVTVEITKHTRNLIESYRLDGEKIDDAVSRLIKSSGNPIKYDRTKTNIRLSDTTMDILREHKAYSTESHNNTLMRLLENTL